VPFDDAPLRKLMKLVPPPAKTRDTGSPEAWRAAEKTLGSPYPEEYKRFVAEYGRCALNAYLYFLTPFDEEHETYGIQPMLKWFRYAEGLVADRGEKPNPIWPEKDGLLFIAETEPGDFLAYQTKGPPDQWTITLYQREQKVEPHPHKLVEFLTRLAEGTLDVERWRNTEELKGKITAK
jgi:hypothetical protein